MPTKINAALFVIAVVFLLCSCQSKKESLPASSGKTAEILFLIDKSYWNGRVGDSIRAVFKSDYLLLNQPEPKFNLANIEEKDFSNIFESHHNIFIVDINPQNTKPKFELKKDVWAKPQMIFKISAANTSDFLNVLSTQQNQILNCLQENERARIIKSLIRDEDVTITNTLNKLYGIALTCPKGYFIATKSKDFCWIRRETETTSTGIILNFYPYTDTLSFNESIILNRRDSLTKNFIPGPTEGSYMQVSQNVVLPVFKTINFKGHYAIETRGLWEVKNDFMGGPFMSFTFVDETKNRVTTLDAFVYAPQEEKRNFMMHAESILYTFESCKNK